MTMNTVGRVRPAGEPKVKAGHELKAALASCKTVLIALAVASALINVLYLSGSIYMLEVYDRVLTSRSIPTLIGLSVLVFVLFVFQGFLDLLRGRVLIRVARYLGQSLSQRVFELIPRMALATRTAGDGLQPMRDLDQIRAFLSSGGPVAFLDLPWMPFYVAICFAFHFWIGVTALGGAIIIVVITVLTDFMTRAPQKAATELGGRRQALAEASRRNAEVLQAMGMRSRVAAIWGDVNSKFLDSYQRSSDVSSGFGAMSKVLRMMLQSAVLGVGAYLVIVQEASAGIIIASSILSARALAPVDLAIANWKGFVSARQSWQRLNNLLSKLPADDDQMELPKPMTTVTVQSVSVVPPGDRRLVLVDVAFRLDKGSALGVVGPSAGGKSSLVRTLVGLWPAARGTVRLDGAALDQWSTEMLGRHIGYLPQSVELLSGTIAQNIARFDPDAKADHIIAAARAAGVHDLVLHLSDGYETEIGEGGSILSAGQRQRIALARALYGDPFLVVLDEPNSNLDAEGEEALTKAILGVRARGGIVVVVAHRGNVLASVDQMMVISEGRVQLLGPKEEVLAKLRRPAAAPAPTGLRVVNDPAGAT